MFLRPVSRMSDAGVPSLVTVVKRMMSSRSSEMAGRSFLT